MSPTTYYVTLFCIILGISRFTFGLRTFERDPMIETRHPIGREQINRSHKILHRMNPKLKSIFFNGIFDTFNTLKRSGFKFNIEKELHKSVDKTLHKILDILEIKIAHEKDTPAKIRLVRKIKKYILGLIFQTIFN